MLEEKADYSVSMMARVLGVSRSGSCRWLKAGGSGEDPWGPSRRPSSRYGTRAGGASASAGSGRS
jgi:transposase-like protein